MTTLQPLVLQQAGRLPVTKVLAGLGVTEAGLSSDEAARRLASLGPNVLASHQVTAFGVLLRQLHPLGVANPIRVFLADSG